MTLTVLECTIISSKSQSPLYLIPGAKLGCLSKLMTIPCRPGGWTSMVTGQSTNLVVSTCLCVVSGRLVW